MAVPTVNLVIESGTDFSRTFTLRSNSGSLLNLSNYTFSAKMRKWSGSSGSVSFATTYGADPSQGRLTISMGSSITGIVTEGRYNYDVLIDNAGTNTITKVIVGQITVNPTIS
tara:strand:+ start:1223 stop:1561 length:339 start_codon:yes stop_codon:yes gene_type:complete